MSRVLIILALVTACSKHHDDPPPAQPGTGAPVAFVVDKVLPDHLAVRAYNFGDKPVNAYDVMIRYYDAKGEVLDVNPGTDFEQSWDNWSFAGRKYTCDAKAWCSLEVEPSKIPAGAVKADILAEHVGDFMMKEHIWPGSDKEERRWPAAFAPWDRAQRKAAWQGAWAGEGFGLGSKGAWEVKDRDIAFVDAHGTQQFTLSLDSPCTAGFAGGTNGGWVNVYTIKDGQLITGLGDAGQKIGDKAIVCGGGAIYVLEGTTCTEWEDHFGHWKSSPGTCGFKDGGFSYTRNNYESKLLVDGDTIWSEQLKNTHAAKFPNLAAAKQSQGL